MSIDTEDLTTGQAVRLLAAGLTIIITAIVSLVGGIGGLHSTDGGQVAVVRNGGLFDSRDVRGIIKPASGLEWAGLWSDVHDYPAAARFYTITSDQGRGERTGVDVVNVPSADGVSMGVEGTVYFTLAQDPKTLAAFDDAYGTRTFTGLDKEQRHAYDGESGWSTFLDQIVRPVIENDLRQTVAKFRCADLLSSCGVVQNTAVATAHPGGAITQVQDAVNASLPAGIKGTLGGEFLNKISFNLTKLTLPTGVQDAVNAAQAAYADVSKAQAKVKAATAEAEANRARQHGYNACPACAQIDIMRAIPPSVTTFAPGSGVAIGTK